MKKTTSDWPTFRRKTGYDTPRGQNWLLVGSRKTWRWFQRRRGHRLGTAGVIDGGVSAVSCWRRRWCRRAGLGWGGRRWTATDGCRRVLLLVLIVVVVAVGFVRVMKIFDAFRRRRPLRQRPTRLVVVVGDVQLRRNTQIQPVTQDVF